MLNRAIFVCPIHRHNRLVWIYHLLYILGMDQLDSFSHTKYLTAGALAQSQYIASKLPYKPPKYEPVKHKHRVLSHWPAVCCCDGCPMRAACADTGAECEAFRVFVKAGKWHTDDIARELRCNTGDGEA